MTDKEREPGVDNDEGEEYGTMEDLERLESLREEMEELGVSTLREVEARIAELHARLDERERRR